jgi:predicted lipid-binding transport protein (Tim44 family)
MKKLLSVIIALIGLSLVAIDADARRLGGGRNIGSQRSIQQQAAPKAPAQQQQQQQQAANTAPAQQPAAAPKWLGPLAGLALGAGLFALFLNNGWAGVLAGLLMIALIVAAGIFLARMLRARSAERPIQYAGAASGGATAPLYGGGAGAAPVSTGGSHVPADFDAGQFVRHARLNFVRMQEAHDKGDASMIRDFVTPELYRELEQDLREVAGKGQHTEVRTLEAEVVDVATEGGDYVVSVRFSGLIRERADGDEEPFSEIWHLQKPVRGRSGWLVAGIQQDGQA